MRSSVMNAETRSFSMKEQVLQAIKDAGKPVNASEIAKATGIEKADVDKAFAALKKEGAITSPVRCKWEAK